MRVSQILGIIDVWGDGCVNGLDLVTMSVSIILILYISTHNINSIRIFMLLILYNMQIFYLEPVSLVFYIVHNIYNVLFNI